MIPIIETELKSQIIEDMERLKEDISDLIKEKRKNQYSGQPGRICPRCGRDNAATIDSRNDNGFQIRRRECRNCGKKWNTIEIVQA